MRRLYESRCLSKPRLSLADELELYVKAGFSPRFLGRENDLGTVESGKLADLVLLEANPLDDINNVGKISALVYDGKYYRRETLDAMLAKAQTLASRKSIAETLLQTIAARGISAAIQQGHELKTSQSGEYDYGEEELNTLGYQLLQGKKVQDAICIFQLNVKAYPQSGNIYDRLAEAHMGNGQAVGHLQLPEILAA